jgi:hypothetical protein
LKKKLEYEFALYDSDNGSHIEKTQIRDLINSMVDLAIINRESSIAEEDEEEYIGKKFSKNESQGFDFIYSDI